MGLPGLLLSTPLTVCLIVIGRQVPRLRYLEVLFGEQTGLPPSEHFYQRMLAENPRNARALVETTLKTRSRAEVYDTVIVPALTMIEEARHSEEMTAVRAEEVLQSVEELIGGLTSEAASGDLRAPASVLCIPARDFADEIACELATQVLAGTATVYTLTAESSLANVQDVVAQFQPKVICVVGVPPRAIRHTQLRCRQIRARLPESVVVACILSDENELSALRSRIPTEDAQHVVSSLHLMRDYLVSVLHPEQVGVASRPTAEAADATEDLQVDQIEVRQLDPFDGPVDGMFDRLATHLARSFDAPIALITAVNGEQHFWEAQCGLPEDSLATGYLARSCSICNQIVISDEITVVGDTAEDERFGQDPFLRELGIRFCVAAPLKDHEETLMGSLCVLDTRPRQVTEKQRETIKAVAESVMMAIAMNEPVRAEDKVVREDALLAASRDDQSEHS